MFHSCPLGCSCCSCMESVSEFITGSSASPGPSFPPWLFTLSLALAGQLLATGGLLNLQQWVLESYLWMCRPPSRRYLYQVVFGQLSIWARVLLEEETAFEATSPSYWPIGKSVGSFAWVVIDVGGLVHGWQPHPWIDGPRVYNKGSWTWARRASR